MNEDALSQLYLKDTAFQHLMQKRIFNVLLVASPYDAFMMEEDGRIEEQLYFEYVALNLSSPPRVTRVSTMDEAEDAVRRKHFGAAILMPGSDISETIDGARRLKAIHPTLPVVMLTPFSKEVSRRLANEDLSRIDYVFSWLGNVDLLMAIIKLLEDKRNADNDILRVGVQTIMVVEDSVRFYSSVLPHIYKSLLKQSYESSTEALNEHEQMLRMRGRPKVILARDYDEAVNLMHRYGDHLLGVISDISFKRQGQKDPEAGFRLVEELRRTDPYLPIILESSESHNRDRAEGLGCVFLDKNSKKLPVDLSKAIAGEFSFGDFVMTDPDTGRDIRIASLKDLQNYIFDIPAQALLHHASSNDISRWLYSRALFPIAEVIKQHRFYSLDEVPAVRQLFFDLIVKYRKMKNRGVVAVFRKDRFDHYSNFARIGQGSLGGKGRGLAFIDHIIKQHPEVDNFGGISISIPRTIVVCTDIFDEFMSENDLYPVALSDATDAEILQRFLQATLPLSIKEDFGAVFDVIDKPLAVRSSSLLEDSHYQPFAGVYATHMIPNVSDREQMLHRLCDAIKSVYASVFFKASKQYMTATSNLIDQEKMAVIIQEVVGQETEGLYYPSFSGVGRSLNYYPVGRERTVDGVAQIAIGLGKHIVDGGTSLRFSPRQPKCSIQTSELKLALRDTQRTMLALDLNSQYDKDHTQQTDDSYNLVQKSIQDIAPTGRLRGMVSTFDIHNQLLRDCDEGSGRRVVTFNPILHHEAIPLARAVDFMLTTGQREMARPVEIEFACNIVKPSAGHTDVKAQLYWLQIRPIVEPKNMVDVHLFNLPENALVLRSDTALGHGSIDDVKTIVYVSADGFCAETNRRTAELLSEINANMLSQKRPYMLLGPGRWGSSDASLGIPVRWSDIAGARVIVEASTEGVRMEPSQGTHFFQNLTSFGVGYFTIDTAGHNGYIDRQWLENLAPEATSGPIRILRTKQPLAIGIDGRKGVGVVARVDSNTQQSPPETLLEETT